MYKKHNLDCVTMKTSTTNTLLSAVLCVLCFAQFTVAQEDFKVLTIKARVTFENEPLDEISVQLFEGNKMILQEDVKKGGKLKYTLYSNRVYTLQLNKDGYYTKRISISTRIPEDYLGKELFEFEIGMIPRGGEEIQDEGLLDYPSALIGFHPKYDKFYYDVDYDKQLKADIRASSTFKGIVIE